MAVTPARLLRRTRWEELAGAARDAWLGELRPPSPDADVAAIIAEVRRDGDAALRRLTSRLDGVELDDLHVPAAEFEDAHRSVPAETRRALEAAHDAIRRFHADQRNAVRETRRVVTGPGVTAWRRWLPLERVGGYVPGGRAAYPSSVLMLGVPAALAGVGELLIATPPRPDGRVDPACLVAAELVGIRRVLRVGGAQAIAALAYGTDAVPRVDRIFGAGNAWVTAAKRAVAADTPIDLPAGPSECIVIADAGADPELVAADLLAQAEHGPDSIAILVTDAPPLADAVDERLVELAGSDAGGEPALVALRAWGRCLLVASMPEAVAAANAIAAEHVSLQCADAEALAAGVRHAGSLFIGGWSAIAAGDYATGTNHVLPTGAAARVHGGIGVEAFGRWMTVQRVTPRGARRLAPIVDALAAAEGLPAHGRSVRLRAERVPGGAPEADGAVALLRRPEPVEPYAAEASDEELALAAGLAVAEIVRYDMNTLGGGALPAVRAALAAEDADRLVEYGDLGYRRLRELLGGRTGVDPARIVVGAGADELIRLSTTMAVGAGDAVLVPTPTFGMFAVEARLAGARVVAVERTAPGTPHDAGALRDAAERESARLVWLCSPNNPTGDRLAPGAIRRIAAGLPAIVVVDEVYLEFAEADEGLEPESSSAIRLQGELPNLLILRSLAKAYGLAGARIGYLVVPPALSERFGAARLPLPVGGTSAALAAAALSDPASARRRHHEIVAERRRLAATLERLGCEVLPGVANFVTFRPPDGAALAAALLRRGLVVRSYASGVMAGWLRATARATAENDRLIGACEELLE